jgi:hypothetical protein
VEPPLHIRVGLEFKPNIGYVNLRNHDVYLSYKGLPRHMTLVGSTSRS